MIYVTFCMYRKLILQVKTCVCAPVNMMCCILMLIVYAHMSDEYLLL